MLTFIEYTKEKKIEEEDDDEASKLNVITTFFKQHFNYGASKEYPRIIFSDHFIDRVNNNRKSDIKIRTKDLHKFFDTLGNDKDRLLELKQILDTMTVITNKTTQEGIVLTNRPLKNADIKKRYQTVKRSLNLDDPDLSPLKKKYQLYQLNDFIEKNKIPFLLNLVITKKRDDKGILFLFNTILKQTPDYNFYKKENDILFLIEHMEEEDYDSF